MNLAQLVEELNESEMRKEESTVSDQFIAMVHVKGNPADFIVWGPFDSFQKAQVFLGAKLKGMAKGEWTGAVYLLLVPR